MTARDEEAKLPEGTAQPPLTPLELAEAVRSVDPAAILVRPRILRRVIHQHHALVSLGLWAPHRKCYVIDRDSLLAIAEKSELGLDDDAELADRVILLAFPESEGFSDWPTPALLLRCWRLLFHARVHAAFEDRQQAGLLTPGVVRRRIHAIGEAEFDEIRLVLGQEDLLLPPRTDVTIYVEFAATYQELRRFAPEALPHYFPGLRNTAAIDGILAQDIDAEALFEATRLEGAPDPREIRSSDETEEEIPLALTPFDSSVPREAASPTKYRVFMRRALRPALAGNVVRAAICRAKAERCAPPELLGRVRIAMKLDVDRLVARLQAALGLAKESVEPWQEAIAALVRQTTRGIWTVEARLLYDLQKVCVDCERGIYTVDLVEWALSWGRRPIQRDLPKTRDVLLLKHLRSAARRVPVARISEDGRRHLLSLLHRAIREVETRLRDGLRPVVSAALDKVGLKAGNPPERVAKKKLIEELLDQIDEHGFLTMGMFRDAISRNNLKLPDIAHPLDFLHGDLLLRADARLATSLDGVYHRGEFYMRWMQRLSSLAFGTRIGRFATRFIAVPFGGAYVALAGVHEIWQLIFGHAPPTDVAPGLHPVEHAVAGGLHVTSPSIVVALGLILLGLVNWAGFRLAVVATLRAVFQGVRVVVVEPIRWVIQSALLQKLLHNVLATASFRFLIMPLMVTAIVWRLIPERNPWHTLGTAAAVFLAVNLLLNSRWGRNAEEMAADWIARGWRRFGLRVITGLFLLIVDLFKRVVETFERLTYTVDEWLRFKSGESGATFIGKALLGLLWFFAAYVMRFAVNVLIEPQINPIKHFPVVTVSHKLLLPLIPPFAGVLELTLDRPLAWTIAATTIWCIPGVFGFLVWELKENWRLYAANRSPWLRPVSIGSHGETMARLLIPGFHSGTVPKRFARLRRAERSARASGNWKSAQKHIQSLRHVALSMRRCVEREFLELLVESQCWRAPRVTLEQIRLSVNGVVFSLTCDGFSGGPLELALHARSGWIVANVAVPGWIESLLPHQRQVFVSALVGFYHGAGVELVCQQIESEFVPPVSAYDVVAQGLAVWPDENYEVEVFYDLHSEKWTAPQSVRGLSRRRLPTLQRDRLVFGDTKVAWERWVEVWNLDAAGQGHPRHGLVTGPFLPS